MLSVLSTIVILTYLWLGRRKSEMRLTGEALEMVRGKRPMLRISLKDIDEVFETRVTKLPFWWKPNAWLAGWRTDQSLVGIRLSRMLRLRLSLTLLATRGIGIPTFQRSLYVAPWEPDEFTAALRGRLYPQT
jgi:hypothetical protein